MAPYYVLEYPDWVQIVALNDRDEVLLIRQYRHALGDISLELPAGAMDPDDAGPLGAAHRELLEETGCVAGEAEVVGVFSPNPASHANRIHTVLMQGVRLTQAQKEDPSERIVTAWTPIPEAFALAVSGGMVTAIQVASLVSALAKVGRLALREP